jgi:hypothetical protein
LPKSIRPVNEASILDRDAHPDVGSPGEARGELRQPCLALGEDLKGVLLRRDHDLEDPTQVLDRDVFVEEVAHRVDEDRSGTPPPQRLLETLRPQPKVEALLVWMVRNSSPSLCEGLGVAVRASW